jgi:hypothetical protein
MGGFQQRTKRIERISGRREPTKCDRDGLPGAAEEGFLILPIPNPLDPFNPFNPL